MKTYVAIPLCVAVFASLLLTCGCVPKSELDKMKALNLRMDEQRKEALEEARNLQNANEVLNEKLTEQEAALQAADQKIALLGDDNDRLRKEVDDLARQARELMESAKLPVVGPINVLPVWVDQKLKEFAQANPELAEYLPKYGMVKLKADLTFDKGSDFLRPEAVEAMKKFAEIVNAPDAAQFNIYVAGHTDDIPIVQKETLLRHPNNWYLSVHRAVAVQEILVKADLTPGRIGAMGFGEFHPVAPNEAGRKGNPLNRRVEIWIVPPDRLLTASEK